MPAWRAQKSAARRSSRLDECQTPFGSRGLHSWPLQALLCAFTPQIRESSRACDVAFGLLYALAMLGRHCLRGGALVAALLAVSCAKRQPALGSYPFRLLVTNVPGEPLSGVAARIDGRLLGKTDEHGAVALSLSGRDGQRVNIHLECPPNHQAPKAPLEVALFRYAAGSTPELTAVCSQERVAEAVVVRTPGAHDIPLYARGERIGETDAQGVAHLLLNGAPGENIDLSFDTSERPELRPANPSVRVALGAQDDVVLAEQRFETRAKPRAKASSAPRSGPAPSKGPVRIR